MYPYFPLLLTVFFGVFHVLGGGALGQSIRAARRGSDQAIPLVLWGAFMGGLPLVFDWFFLVAQDHLVYGLIGPVLFVVTTVASAFLDLVNEGPAVVSAALGSAGFLIGLLSIPLMLDRAKEFDVGVTDYLFGGLFVLLFVLIGGAVAWNGISELLLSISFDRTHAERERDPKHARDRGKR